MARNTDYSRARTELRRIANAVRPYVSDMGSEVVDQVRRERRRQALPALKEFVPKLGTGRPDENQVAMDVLLAAVRHAQHCGATAEQIKTMVEAELAR